MTNRHFWSSVLVLLSLGLLLIWLGRFTNADLYLADLMFDFATKEFPRRSQWFFDDFMHHTLKALMLAVALVPVTVLLVDAFHGRQMLDSRTRGKLAVVVASAILVPLAIGTTKAVSIHHCPWSLSRYGGFAPYLRIFDGLPTGVQAGHCFPAGHASSALWLASIALFWLPEHPAKACVGCIVGLFPGFALGLAQQARGAHFMTHTLWSVWIAVLVVVVLARLFDTISRRNTSV